MPSPVPFTQRSRAEKIVLAGLVPFVFGAVLGVAIGISAGAYWGLAILAAIGAVLGGREHPDARSGAYRGLVGGAVFGIGLLLAHAVAGTEPEVSLGSFPPLIIVIDALAGMLLSALGGRLSRR